MATKLLFVVSGNEFPKEVLAEGTTQEQAQKYVDTLNKKMPDNPLVVSSQDVYLSRIYYHYNAFPVKEIG